MARPENSFITGVHRYLPPGKPYHMKNHNVYQGGVFDVWYSGDADDLWVEYKFIDVPKRPSTIIDMNHEEKMLSRLQQLWGLERHKEGRNIAVIVGCKDGGVWMPGITWQTSLTAEEFRAKIQSRADLAAIIYEHTNGRKISGTSGRAGTKPAR
jgi:hypothetical protein